MTVHKTKVTGIVGVKDESVFSDNIIQSTIISTIILRPEIPVYNVKKQANEVLD